MHRFGPLLVVFVAIALNISGAIVLKEIASMTRPHFLTLLVGLSAVLTVNILRFLIWGIAHKNYPLSKTYPLSSLFFPLILLVSYFYGEEISQGQIIGGIVITFGVFWLSWIDEVETDVTKKVVDE